MSEVSLYTHATCTHIRGDMPSISTSLEATGPAFRAGSEAPRAPAVLLPAAPFACVRAWKREFILPWRKAGSHNHHDDMVDSDQ